MASGTTSTSERQWAAMAHVAALVLAAAPGTYLTRRIAKG